MQRYTSCQEKQDGTQNAVPGGPPRPLPLTPVDRRLLLTSTLWMFFQRARRGQAVRARDLVGLSVYGDPDEPQTVEKAAA
jgi:hypothetical protein